MQYTTLYRPRVPNAPATPNRSVRIPDEIWAKVRRLADDEGVTMTEIVLRALNQYIRERLG